MKIYNLAAYYLSSNILKQWSCFQKVSPILYGLDPLGGEQKLILGTFLGLLQGHVLEV
jgi:hypothetical protein